VVVFFNDCSKPLDHIKVGEILNQLRDDKYLFFLLGDSPVSEFYVPTFRNILSVTSVIGGAPMKMEQSETSVNKIQTSGRWNILFRNVGV
jgi:hypothetical protein